MLAKLALAGLASASLLGGCIERRIQVTSDPPGATVWLNDVEIGTTPTEADFRYFGTYDVRLRKAGYEPLATKRKAEAPFYEYPGPDLIAEALPGTNETIIKWHFTLEPAKELQGDPRQAEDELIKRAKELAGQIPQDADAKAAEAEKAQPPVAAPAAGEPAKPDAAKTEDAKPDAAKTDAAKSEPVRPEPAKSEPAKSEPAKPGAADKK